MIMLVAGIITALVLFIVKLAVIEGAVLGIVLLINTLAGTDISYFIVGGIVAGLMALLWIAQVVLLIAAQREANKADSIFDKWFFK